MEDITFAQSSEFGDYYYSILPDTDYSNPREEYDNLGTMICFHRRYLLGDHKESKNYSDPSDFLRTLSGIDTDTPYYERLFEKLSEEEINQYHMDKALKNHIILPLYLYDHSGISISTGSFSDPWDSGQVCWIYVSHTKIQEEYKWKNLTKKRIEQIEKYLKGEVETYDDFLTGNVYGFKVYEPVSPELEAEETDEEIHSCWGFFGDPDKSGIKDEVFSIIKCDIEQRRKQAAVSRAKHFDQLKIWIRNKVALIYRTPLAF
jgi:hypothetical protein